MKIAIIENEENVIQKIKTMLCNMVWEVKFYTSSAEFSKENLNGFSVIIASQELPVVSGRNLLYAIHAKTSAELYLMCSTPCLLPKEDVENEYIKGFLNKNNLNIVLDKLQYVETKLKIVQLIDTEEHNIEEIINKANGYSFETENNIGFVKCKNLLTAESEKSLYKKIERSNVNKIIFLYPELNFLTTIHCSQLLNLIKFFKKNDKKFAFLNIKKLDIIRTFLVDCKLNEIMPIFNTQESAIVFLNQ